MGGLAVDSMVSFLAGTGIGTALGLVGNVDAAVEVGEGAVSSGFVGSLAGVLGGATNVVVGAESSATEAES